jgi:hypothetical protein
MTITIEEVYELGTQLLKGKCWANDEVRDRSYDKMVDSVLKVERNSLPQVNKYLCINRGRWVADSLREMTNKGKRKPNITLIFDIEMSGEGDLLGLQDLINIIIEDPQEREVLSLHVQGMSGIEISEALEVTTPRVSQIFKVIRKRIACALQRLEGTK